LVWQIVQHVFGHIVAAGWPVAVLGVRLKQQKRLVGVCAQDEQIPYALRQMRPATGTDRCAEEQQLTLAHGEAGQPPGDAGKSRWRTAVGCAQAQPDSVIAEIRWPRLPSDGVWRQLGERHAESKRQPERQEEADPCQTVGHRSARRKQDVAL
jgi:hypothetical protein